MLYRGVFFLKLNFSGYVYIFVPCESFLQKTILANI